MTSRTLATAVALWAGVAMGAASDTVHKVSKTGVALDTRTAERAVRSLTYGDGTLPLALAGWYGDSGTGTRWTLARRVNGGDAETLATGRTDTSYDWSLETVGTTVLTLTAADGTALSATFKADVYYVKGEAAQDLKTPATGKTATTTLTLDGVALDTRTTANAARTLTKNSQLLPFALSGWYGRADCPQSAEDAARWGNAPYRVTLTDANRTAEEWASGTEETVKEWTPDTVGTSTFTLTAADGTALTATFTADRYFVNGAEDLTPGSAKETVAVTLTLDGVALDTRTAANAARTVSTADEILPISWSGDGWAGTDAAAAATVTETSPQGTAAAASRTGEGTYAFAPSSIGTWTFRHEAAGATANAMIILAVPGAGTATTPYQLTAATGFVDGLKAEDYVNVPAAAKETIATQAKEDHFVLVPRGGTAYQVVADTATFTATWLNADGAEIEKTEVTVYETPAHEAVGKAFDAQYDYTFKAWSPAPEAIVSNVTYTAQFESAVRSYTVTFKNEDGTVLDSQTLKYGATPAYAGATPVKAATAQYTYTFKGWDKTVVAVTGEAIYTATYEATVNSYTITWKNDDGTEIDTTTVAYGETPVHGNPSKAATEKYTYTFKAWSPTPAAVTGAATYTATYTEAKVKYTLAFVIDETTTETQQLEWDAAITKPAKPDRGEWYEFLGWDPATMPATMPTENLTFTAQWKKHSKLVYSESKAGVALDTTVATNEVRLVSKADDILSITHSGDGWTKTAATAAATVKAVAPKGAESVSDYTGDGTDAFAPSAIGTWTLTHTAEDGTALSAQFAYVVPGSGTEAAPYALAADFVAGVAANDYVTIPAASYEVVALAAAAGKFALVPRGGAYLVLADDATFKITWRNDDGTEIEETDATVNTVPTHDPLTKESTAQYDYAFAAWTPAPEKAVSNATYTATFTSTVRSYTVTFADEDGTPLKAYTLDYGATPEYDGDTPVKAATAQYTYTFKGWDKAIETVTDAATYTATYEATVNSYTITWKNDDGTEIDTTTVAYGETPVHGNPSKTATAQYTYTFAGWSPEIAEVTGATTYTATYTETANKYTLRWMLGDDAGTVIGEAQVAYGAAVTKIADPVRDEWYTFLGWDRDIPATMPAADLTITALWKKHSKLVYSESKAGVALDTTVAEGAARPVKDAADILPLAVSGANFRSATTKGGWTVEAEHLGKVETVGTGSEETTLDWAPTYTGTNTLTLTSTRSADYTLKAVFVVGEEAAENTDAGTVGGETGAEAGSVTVTVAGVALDTRTAERQVREVKSKDEVLPFALSGDAFTRKDADAAYAVSLATDGGDASIWASGTGDALKEWSADAAGTHVFTLEAADGSELAATFAISAKAAYGDAAGELDGTGGAETVSVSLANVLLDTRTAAGGTRTFASQAALAAELLPFTYSGSNWTPGGAGKAVVTVDGNGTVSTFVQATSGEGTRTWAPQGAGTYTFAHAAAGETGKATFVIAADLVYPVDANGGAGWLYLSKDTSDASEWGYAGDDYADWSEAVRKAQTGDITDVLVSGGQVYITFRVRLTESASEEGGVADWADLSVAGGKLKVLRQTALSSEWDAAANADVTELTPEVADADDLTVTVAVPLDAVSGTKAFFRVIVTD